MKFNLKNKKILVTGGADGLGLSLINILLEKINDITCLDKNIENAEYFEKKNVNFFKIYFRNLDETKNLSNKIDFGSYDVIINCAGYEIGSFLVKYHLMNFKIILIVIFFTYIYYSATYKK